MHLIITLRFRIVSHRIILSIVFLVLGNEILAKIQRKNELRMQQSYQQMFEAEQKRMQNEYEQRSDEMARKWKAQLDEEKHRLQKVNEFFS